MTRRSFLAAAAALPLASQSRTKMGIATTSYIGWKRFRDTADFLEHAHALGAAGIQAPIAGDPAALRARAEKLGMYVEAMIRLPRDGDASAFGRDCLRAKAMGASVVRANAGGRRYEDFSTLADFQAFKARSLAAVKLAVPIAEQHGIPLALENHKDWTLPELTALLKSYSGEYLGACLDFGNSIALCEDPIEVAAALAPFTLCTHVKDMGVEPYPDGFLLSELRLGQGFLDLARIVGLVRRHRPKTNFTLEMITRDPLKIPCLAGRYWATFPAMPAPRLARALRLVEEHKRATPLPRVTQLPPEEFHRVMEENNVACLRYARDNMTYL